MKDYLGNLVISQATIDRLPLYFRTLRQMQQEHQDIISSEELGKRLSITPEQIRKDLAYFGQFGKKGVGYCVRELMGNIKEILGLQHKWNIAVLGIGHMGWALVNYRNFEELGFNVVAIFDVAPNKVGQCVKGIKVSHLNQLEEVMQENNIHIGIITVPECNAQQVADKLVAVGVRGIWNFAPRKLIAPGTVRIINEDLSVGLSHLSFYLARQVVKKEIIYS